MNIVNKNFLSNELVKWRDSGIIDQATASKIAGLYSIDMQDTGDKKSAVLKFVAYLFFALSLFTLIGANWEEIPRFVRLLIVLGILGLVNLAAFLRLKNGDEKQSTALFFLGNFCYGGAIALVAQIYHLGEHMPDGVLLWAIGAFALSVAVQKSILTTQSLIIALVWFIMELELNLISHGFILFILISLYMLYKDESGSLTFMLFVSIFAYLVSYTVIKIETYDHFDAYLPYRLSMFCLSYAIFGIFISLILEKYQKNKIAYTLKIASIMYGSLVLISLSLGFEDTWFYGVVIRGEHGFNAVEIYKGFNGTLYLLFTLISLAGMVWLKRYYTAGLCVILLLLPFSFPFMIGYSKGLFSLITVLVGVVLIKQNFVLQGLIVIFLIALIRYIDLIGDYVGASLLFLIFAVTVLFVSKKRRVK